MPAPTASARAARRGSWQAAATACRVAAWPVLIEGAATVAQSTGEQPASAPSPRAPASAITATCCASAVARTRSSAPRTASTSGPDSAHSRETSAR
ncbi:MAG TPA: hypothetical protein VFX53_08780 [Pedococcus sp.]|nr:hypothetical protein [Pedococcus sp.]